LMFNIDKKSILCTLTKKSYIHKHRAVLGLKHRGDDDASVTAKDSGVGVGSVYRNNTTVRCDIMH